MPQRLTIKEVERKYSDFMKGQRWRGHAAKYKYWCEKHGTYLKSYNRHDQGQRCQKCAGFFGLSKTPEYRTVWNHFRCILKPHKESMKRSYKGMPFYDDWNPEKGGSFAAGALWIIKHLGRRPKNCTMHIVDHGKGFVPDNLEWSGQKRQSAQKMFKIIADLKHRIKELELEIANLKSYS